MSLLALLAPGGPEPALPALPLDPIAVRGLTLANSADATSGTPRRRLSETAGSVCSPALLELPLVLRGAPPWGDLQGS